MVASELKDCITLDDTYNEENKVKGYESNQIENEHLQHISEDKMKTMLDNHRTFF
jgi:hypothetical protein